MKFLLLSLFVVAYASAAAIPEAQKLPDVPDEIMELVPPELRKMIEGLSEEDKKHLSEAAKEPDEEKAIEQLKKQNPVLGKTVEKMYKTFIKKVDGLKNDAAKEFAQKIIAGAKKTQSRYIAGEEIPIADLKKEGREAVKEFQNLPTAAKTELNKTFPQFIAFFESEKFLKKINSDAKEDD